MLVRAIVIAILIAAPLGSAGGLDRSSARTFELRRDVRALRTQVDRAPRAASFDLKGLQRRLHERRIDDPRDPRLGALALELRRLRAGADCAAHRPSAAVLPRTTPLSSPAPVEQPRYLGGAHTPMAAPPARRYFGQQLVALQRSVAAIERRLALRDTAGAARLLEAVESDLATLRAAFSPAADDPNVIALEDQIRALGRRLPGG
jgi:hypothetical protein